MSVNIVANISSKNIDNFMKTLSPESFAIFSDYFRDIHSKEILENFPLPALADQERADLNEYLKAGCYEY